MLITGLSTADEHNRASNPRAAGDADSKFEATDEKSIPKQTIQGQQD